MPLHTHHALPGREGEEVSGCAPEEEGARNTPSILRALEAIRHANEQADEAVIAEATERFTRELEAEMPPD